MATLKISDKLSAQSLVIGISNKAGTLVVETSIPGFNAKPVLAILSDLGAKAKAGTVTKFPYAVPNSPYKILYAVGLGDNQKQYEHETLRRAAGAAARELCLLYTSPSPRD